MSSMKILLLAPLEYISSCVSIKVVNTLLVAGSIYYVINDPSARRRAVREREQEQNNSAPGELKALLKNATTEIELGTKQNMFAKVRNSFSSAVRLSAIKEESISFIARTTREVCTLLGCAVVAESSSPPTATSAPGDALCGKMALGAGR
jgi:ribosomal protein S20